MIALASIYLARSYNGCGIYREKVTHKNATAKKSILKRVYLSLHLAIFASRITLTPLTTEECDICQIKRNIQSCLIELPTANLENRGWHSLQYSHSPRMHTPLHAPSPLRAPCLLPIRKLTSPTTTKSNMHSMGDSDGEEIQKQGCRDYQNGNSSLR